MSKKALLTEKVTRKMMKLANIGPLADKFVNENYLEEEETPMEEGLYEDDEELGDAPPEETPDVEEPVDAELPGEEMVDEPMDMDVEPAGDVELSQSQKVDVLKAIMDALGIEGDVEETGDEGEVEEPVGDEPELVQEKEEALEEGEETLEETEVLDEEELVEQVMNRVAARLKNLSEGQKKDQLIEALAKKIADKLS